MSHDEYIRRIVVAGRRSGKTAFTTKMIIQAAMDNPHSINWCFAPDRAQADAEFDLIIQTLRPSIVKKPDYTDLCLEIDNGAVIACKVPIRAEVQHER